MAGTVAVVLGMSLATGTVGSGVTWLSSRVVSSATKPLVGGAISGGAMLVGLVAILVFDKIFQPSQNDFTNLLIVTTLTSQIVLKMAAIAMGYAVSTPLSLLLAASNVALICRF